MGTRPMSASEPHRGALLVLLLVGIRRALHETFCVQSVAAMDDDKVKV